VDSAACNIRGVLQTAGTFSHCHSGIGAFDMVGNVWELVSGDVINGVLDGAQLPVSGYVASINAAGIPIVTQSTSSPLYYDDYVWTNATGTYAVMRGGFHGGASDAGLYSMQAAIPIDFSSGAIGFRCMQIL
jgi:formylglycine-generating enzyme required for sulfatase activity